MTARGVWLGAVVAALALPACWDFDADYAQWCAAHGCDGGPPPEDGGADDAGTGCDAAVTFDGRWEDGGLGDFDLVEAADPEAQVQLVDADAGPVREGAFAARFEVSPGALHVQSDEERAMVEWSGADETEGDDAFYGFSLLFPDGGFVDSGSRLLVVWKTSGHGGRLGVVADDEGLRLILDRAASATELPVVGGIEKDLWYDLLLHVHWSADPAAGSAQLSWRVRGGADWIDAGMLEGPTLYGTPDEPEPVRLLLGITRSKDQSAATDVVVHDGFRRSPEACGAMPR